MNVFKAAAHGFGPERRVLLLHGPVGSAKSTIVRLIKKGLEAYSRTDEGAQYSFSWKIDGELIPSPMNEEPLLLIPSHARNRILDALNQKLPGRRIRYAIKITLLRRCNHIDFTEPGRFLDRFGRPGSGVDVVGRGFVP